MDLLLFTGNRRGRWTENRKFIWSGLAFVLCHKQLEHPVRLTGIVYVIAMGIGLSPHHTVYGKTFEGGNFRGFSPNREYFTTN